MPAYAVRGDSKPVTHTGPQVLTTELVAFVGNGSCFSLDVKRGSLDRQQLELVNEY